MPTSPAAKWLRSNAASANKNERKEQRRRGETSLTPTNAIVAAATTTTALPIARQGRGSDTTIAGTVIAGPGTISNPTIVMEMAGTATTTTIIVTAVGTATTTTIVVGDTTIIKKITILAVGAMIMMAEGANTTTTPGDTVATMVDTSTISLSAGDQPHAPLSAHDRALERAAGA